MPPMDPPMTAWIRSMPRCRRSSRWARTISLMVTIGKPHAVGLAGRRIDARRARASLTSAEHIGADDKVPVGIDGFAGADKPLPPPRLVALKVGGAMESPVRAWGIKTTLSRVGAQRAVGLIGQRQTGKRLSALQLKRLGRR